MSVRPLRQIRQVLDRERVASLSESRLRDWLGRTLSRDYGFAVETEVSCSKTPSGKPRRIDLYATAPRTWKHHREFPIIAIETKLNCDIGTHVEEILGGKLNDYIHAESWHKDGRSLPQPSIVLYATSLSVLESQTLVCWTGIDSLGAQFPQVAEETFAEIALTVGLRTGYQLFRSVLWECGAAILEGPPDALSFMSNRVNPAGPRYYFRDQEVDF